MRPWALLVGIGLLALAALVGGSRLRRPSPSKTAAPTRPATEASQPPRILVERDEALWEKTGASERRLAGSAHFQKAQRQGQTVYAVEDRTESEDCVLLVLQADAQGRVLNEWRILDEDLHLANAIMRVEWVKPDRLFIDTHVNPSLGIGVVLEMGMGTHRAIRLTRAAWSPDGEHLAYVLDPPHFTPPEARVPAEVYVDTAKLADVPRGQWDELTWTSNNEARLSVANRTLRVTLDGKGKPVARWMASSRPSSRRAR